MRDMDNNKFPGHESGREFQHPVQAKGAGAAEMTKGLDAVLQAESGIQAEQLLRQVEAVAPEGSIAAGAFSKPADHGATPQAERPAAGVSSNPATQGAASQTEGLPVREFKVLENQCDPAFEKRGNALPEASAQAPQERLISWFRAPVSNTVPGGVLSLQEVYQRIKSPMYAAVTNQLRGISDKKQRREFKAKHFDYVTFGGVFSSRRNAALLEPSFMAVFDFDELGEALPRVRELLKHDRVLPTELLFTSPSGNGLKWVVRYEPQVCGYLEFFQGVSHYLHKCYGLIPDASGKDIARACFLCHDPEIFMMQTATSHQPIANSLQPTANHHQEQPTAYSQQPTAKKN